MIEIIALILLAWNIGILAVKKGQSSIKWRFIMVGTWILFEFIGIAAGIIFFGKENFFGLMLIGIASGFGGYLLTKYKLDKMPDVNDDIDKIGSN